MIIQVNTDKNIEGSERFNEYVTSFIQSELDRYDTITRIEMHFSDENGSKNGHEDIKCLIEARLEGKQPIVVSSIGDTNEAAMNGAIDKLKNSLETILDKMKNH